MWPTIWMIRRNRELKSIEDWHRSHICNLCIYILQLQALVFWCYYPDFSYLEIWRVVEFRMQPNAHYNPPSTCLEMLQHSPHDTLIIALKNYIISIHFTIYKTNKGSLICLLLFPKCFISYLFLFSSQYIFFFNFFMVIQSIYFEKISFFCIFFINKSD